MADAGFDYQGASIFVGAIAGAVTLIGGFALQVATFRRQGKQTKAVNELKTAVDGLGDKRVAMGVRAGTAEGHAAGVADERANPQSPV